MLGAYKSIRKPMPPPTKVHGVSRKARLREIEEAEAEEEIEEWTKSY
jgi:hypothetical protein